MYQILCSLARRGRKKVRKAEKRKEKRRGREHNQEIIKVLVVMKGRKAAVVDEIRKLWKKWWTSSKKKCKVEGVKN